MRGTCISSVTGKKSKTRRGIATIWAVLTVLTALGISGLATDTGYVMLAGHQLQSAADNAALAGAAQVQTSTSAATTAAVSTAAKNIVLGTGCQVDGSTDVTCGNFNTTTKVYTANQTPYNAVCVTAKRTTGSLGKPVNLLFGPIFGVTTAEVSRQSIAMAGGAFNAGVVVLSPTASDTLDVAGTSTLNVNNNGGCQVNSSHSAAVNCHSSCHITCTKMRVCGGTSGSSGTLPTNCSTNTTACNDPCASLNQPAKGSDLGIISHSSDGTFSHSAGYYSGGITCSGGPKCKVLLNPGDYVLGGAGLTITGGCTVIADNCTFHLTKGTTPTYPGCNINTTGTCEITPPTSGTYAPSGCCIFHDRNTPSSTNCSITCNANTNIHGLIYAPSCNVKVTCGSAPACGSQILCNTLQCSGSGSCNIDYASTNPCTVNNVALCK